MTTSLTINGIGFLLTAFFETHKITDLVGISAFLAIAFQTLLALPPLPSNSSEENMNMMSFRALSSSSSSSFRIKLILLTIIVWGIRLASFLFFRVCVVGADHRLDAFFRSPGERYFEPKKSFFPIKLLFFWTIQSLWSIICLLPIAHLNPSSLNHPHALNKKVASLASLLPIVAAFLCIIFESIADYQKYTFKSNPKNAKKWCNVGMFRYAQFPNYFFEILFWTFIYISCLPFMPTVQAAFISSVSPIFVVYILTSLSGTNIRRRKRKTPIGSFYS